MLSLGFFDGILGVAWLAAHQALMAPVEQLGWIIAPMGLGSALGALAAPIVMARLQPLPTLKYALTVQVLITLLLVVAPSIAALSLLYGCRGLANGLAHSALNGYFGPRIGAKKLMTVHGAWGIGTASAGVVAGLALDLELPWYAAYIPCGMLTLGAIALLTRIHNRFDGLDHTGPASTQSINRIPWHWGTLALVSSGALYVGLEQSVGNWGSSVLTARFTLDGGLVGLAIGLFWGALTLGRFTLGQLPIREHTLLRAATVGLMLSLLGLWLAPTPTVAIVFLMLSGLCMAPVAPYLLSLGSQMVPQSARLTLTSYQIVAFSAGAACLPLAYGLNAQWLGLNSIFVGFVVIAIALWLSVSRSLRTLKETN